ncbi:juxtaposed with another zinc finger protein 1 isoform X1 [Rattus norvegicus]|uniref:juxtaposed with another zinc finger protein 1 isoform X1 n=1 Tax=Rattus norvegicus TaxID=10116 RepID=UPI002FD80633
MTGIAAASFFSNTCRFGGCGLHFPTLADLIEHIEDNHIDTDPRVLEKQELQQPTYVALSYINRFMTDAARREQESLKKKIQPKLSLTLSSSVSRGNVSTPPRHSSGSLTPPVTPPITPSSSFRSSTPTGSEYDEEEVDYEESDSDESWTTESAISSEAILSSMCMNGGEEKPFACPVPGCKKRYKVKESLFSQCNCLAKKGYKIAVLHSSEECLPVTRDRHLIAHAHECKGLMNKCPLVSTGWGSG